MEVAEGALVEICRVGCELFLTGSGPFRVYEATLSILAGYVFPKPAFALRWRLRALELFVRIHRFLPLAPRREPFSLFADPSPTAAPLAEPWPSDRAG